MQRLRKYREKKKRPGPPETKKTPPMGFLLWRKIPATMGSSLATLGKKKNWPENNRKGEKQSGEKKC